MLRVLAWMVAVWSQDPVGPALPPEALQSEPAVPAAPVLPKQETGEAAPRPSAEPAAPPAPSPKLIPPPESRPASLKLVDRPESGPSLGGFILGSLIVMALLSGTFVLLKRYGRGSRFLGGGGPIAVLSRKSLGPKQDVFLIEVGSKVFLVGSTREQMTTLGEFVNPDEIAILRSNLPGRREDSAKLAFRESLREGIREEETPEHVGPRVFDSIVGELAEIRKTVRGWRA